MFENFQIDPDAIIDTFLSVLFQVFYIPLKYWANLPPVVHYAFYSIVFSFACFMAWMTWKMRNEWRYRL